MSLSGELRRAAHSTYNTCTLHPSRAAPGAPGGEGPPSYRSVHCTIAQVYPPITGLHTAQLHHLLIYLQTKNKCPDPIFMDLRFKSGPDLSEIFEILTNESGQICMYKKKNTKQKKFHTLNIPFFF